MPNYKGTCTFCGNSWRIQGQAAGPGTPMMNCPLCGKPFYLLPDDPPANLLPVKFEDLARNAQAIRELTEVKWPMWFENFGKNISTILSGKDMNHIPKRQGPAIIVGAGPSIYQYEHLKLLGKYADKLSTVITTDRMLKPLVEHGVSPHFVTTVDGSPDVSRFYNLPERLKADAVLDAVTTHPETLKEVRKNLTGEIYWFVHFMDNPLEERCAVCRRLSITSAFHFMSGKKIVTQAGGNAGALAWHLAAFLGCDPVILVGMDYSYRADIPIEETMYYPSYLAIVGGDKDKVKACYEKRRNPYFNNEYVTDLVWEVYRNALFPFLQNSKTTTVNATGGGALHEPPIVSMSLEDAIQKYYR